MKIKKRILTADIPRKGRMYFIGTQQECEIRSKVLGLVRATEIEIKDYQEGDKII